jgi:hypothetical protein
MGTQLDRGRTEFLIKAANKAAALVAVKVLTTTTYGTRTQGFEQANTLEEALDAWHWEADTNEAGDIVYMAFTGDRVSEADKLFTTLAPFVDSGSYIEVLAEGQPFRWRFENAVCHNEDGHVEYDAGPSSRQILENIHAILYADGPATEWNGDTLDAIANEVAKVIPRPVERAHI